MTTYHITPAANAALVAILNGDTFYLAHTPEALKAMPTLIAAKLVTYDGHGTFTLTPAGRRWALIKRQYGDTHPIPRAGGA